ncbi:hypothetical protein GCM10011507_19670 [Edaphobacter acidisoli]|uniref:Uncharacterized protein n=1 Tax=Edaphobacter acidisoli TaxID=2040573 RepID=A0A916RSF8_9BACT|nr:hypothetical protein GCM10011507_19670 [Edaphobacter acidisoli]
MRKKQVVDAVFAVCALSVGVLYERNNYVSDRETAERIKKVSSHVPDNTPFRSEQDIQEDLRQAAKVCWKPEKGDDTRQSE